MKRELQKEQSLNRALLFRGLVVVSAMTGLITQPAHAQKLNSDVKEKAKWYNAPRQIQIIDDRPLVRDFREAPQAPNKFDLPPGPVGNDGSTIPAGGMPIGGGAGQAGYRTPSDPLGELPNARGFGGTNIPAKGLGPRGVLPKGTSTGNVVGKLLTPQTPSGAYAGPIKGIGKTGPAARAASKPAGPAVASYGGNYGQGTGSGSGSSSNKTEALVRGSLLKH